MTAEQPLPLAVQRGLRAAVLALKLARPRGHVPLRVWAGMPGEHAAPSSTCAWFDPGPDEPLDQHARAEVAVALANRVNESLAEPLLWITRSGDLEQCPRDGAWLAAGRSAWLELGLSPSFALLTRDGWWHHPTGSGRRWRRLRA